MTPGDPRGFFSRVRAAISPAEVSVDEASDAYVEQKILALSSVAVMIGAVIWGIVYLAFGGQWAAAVPLGYSAVTAITFVIAIETNRFGWYRQLQFTLILVLPFVLMALLGGFVAGSAVIIWALVSPVGALISPKPQRAPLWFVAFGVLVFASIWARDLPTAVPTLDPTLIAVMFALNLTMPTGIVFLVVRKFVQQRDHARRLLAIEQEKSENLLLNVLPHHVANQLKDNKYAVAEHYDSVSVLFADIVGFTPMSESMSPDRMVTTLNEVFSYFDTVAAKCGVEKIRTIGDNYMVAAGLPERREDHASALADMALAMRDHRAGLPEGLQPLVFRIGINSGPVVAGVIGTSRYQYDIWGDTVNTASRMESHGVPGAIQITAATRDLLGDRFDCELRGTIDVKGKAPMETYLLLGRTAVPIDGA